MPWVLILATLFISNSCNQNLESSKTLFNSTHEVKFKLSSCQKECLYDSGSIISKSVFKDTTYLRLGHWFNCAWADCYLEQAFIGTNRAYFSFDRPHEVEVDRAGKKHRIYDQETACNCYFYLDFKIPGTPNIPDTILINGQPLENFMGERN